MANTLYDKGRQRFLEGNLNWLTDTIKALLVDTGAYTPNFTTHEFLSDIASSARVTSSVTLTSKDTTGGAADITFSSVSGPSIEAIVIYKDTGTEATSPLIAYIDTATGLPITPNGGDIIVHREAQSGGRQDQDPERDARRRAQDLECCRLGVVRRQGPHVAGDSAKDGLFPVKDARSPYRLTQKEQAVAG